MVEKLTEVKDNLERITNSLNDDSCMFDVLRHTLKEAHLQEEPKNNIDEFEQLLFMF